MEKKVFEFKIGEALFTVDRLGALDESLLIEPFLKIFKEIDIQKMFEVKADLEKNEVIEAVLSNVLEFGKVITSKIDSGAISAIQSLYFPRTQCSRVFEGVQTEYLRIDKSNVDAVFIDGLEIHQYYFEILKNTITHFLALRGLNLKF